IDIIELTNIYETIQNDILELQHIQKAIYDEIIKLYTQKTV
ncbi:32608_t:CDS:1, partial [Racocetra persica]